MFKLPIQGNGRSRFSDAQTKAREDSAAAAASAKDKAMQFVGNNLKPAVDKAGELIAEHPGASLAVAVTCGVVIGWLIKRT